MSEEGYGFRWKEVGEDAKPSLAPVRSRGHSDPTADAAIGHIIAEEKRDRRRKERQKQRKKNGYRPKNTGRPRTSVWRKSDEEKRLQKYPPKPKSQPHRTEGNEGGKSDA